MPVRATPRAGFPPCGMAECAAQVREPTPSLVPSDTRDIGDGLCWRLQGSGTGLGASGTRKHSNTIQKRDLGWKISPEAVVSRALSVEKAPCSVPPCQTLDSQLSHRCTTALTARACAVCVCVCACDSGPTPRGAARAAGAARSRRATAADTCAPAVASPRTAAAAPCGARAASAPPAAGRARSRRTTAAGARVPSRAQAAPAVAGMHNSKLGMTQQVAPAGCCVIN